ncbi:MAG: response regulator [Chlorobium sp.]
MKTVLIVDDMINQFKNIHRAITRAGHDVVCVSDGRSALAKAVSMRPDLILMDLMMPEWDGVETIVRIRSIEACKDIPVIFLSSVIASARGVVFADGKEYPIVSKMAEIRLIIDRINECLG